MKNIKIHLVIMLFLIMFFTVQAEAKWWIFGKSNEEVSINYMYLNNISYDESGPKVSLNKETLQDGMIVVNGKASVKKGKIGGVRVSVNNREKWEDAKFSDNGAFEFRFRPEQDKVYTFFVEIMDTAGKTNDIEATRKEVTISGQNSMALIIETLDKMIEAYRNEDANRFMSFVSEDFAGDATNLDRAIRKDFGAFENIDLRYSLNNVAAGAKGRIYASLNFNRSVTSARDGRAYTDSGMTEFVFQLGSVQVYSMKNPLIFGLSDAANVATGTVSGVTNQNVLVVNAKGDPRLITFQEAVRGNWGEEDSAAGSGTVESGTFTLNSCSPPCSVQQGFIFEDNSVVSDWTGDINLEFNLMFLHAGVTRLDLGVQSISSVTEAPASGYTTDDFEVSPNIGHCFAFKLANGKYAVIEIISWTDLGGGNSTASFKYKYQSDGSRNF